MKNKYKIKMADLKIYCNNIEAEALEQIYHMAKYEAYKDNVIRIMPDAHAGAGCTVGTTMNIIDKITPNLVGVDIGCFTGDTKVHLADGRDLSFLELIKEFEEGKENYCYSMDKNGVICISKIDFPRKIKSVNKLIKITLDNGETINCTLDHVFYKIDGSEEIAENLKIGDRLFPLYIQKASDIDRKLVDGGFRNNLNDYHTVYQPKNGRYSFCHKLADDYNERNGLTKSMKSYVRHHIDFNKYNNNPTNIVRMTYQEHWKYHSDHVRETNSLGITGFKAAAKYNPNFYSDAGKKKAESTWRGKNAELNLQLAKERTKLRNQLGLLNSEKQRENSRQRQLTHNTTKFSIQNKDPEFINFQKLGKLKNILMACCGDFSEEHYNECRKLFSLNSFTYKKALEIAFQNNVSFEDIVNYHNHVITNIKIYDVEDVNVYCLTNFEYGNFALSSGVFAHNCGMYVVKFTCDDLNLEKLDGVIRGWVPSGFDIHPGIRKSEFTDRATEIVGALRCGDKHHAALDYGYMVRSVGSLGSGNHFLEVDTNDKGEYFLVIHSGSRNLGVKVCEYYQNMAWNKMFVDSRMNERNKIVAQLKAEGREREIKKTLDALPKLSTKYKDLAYVEGKDFDDYMYDMALCQEFADLNRRAIADAIITHYNNCMKKSPIKVVESWTTIHNYIDHDSMILRKGSVSAREGEKLIIPMNMRDGSLICIGKGNPDWNYSAPHGAGRLMSRSVANRNIDMTEFEKSMSGIYTTSVCEGTKDEAPMVYKPMESIMEQIKDTVEIIDIIKPIYNYKAH